jgi:Zn-dependent M16 (insulinase) family peptidase
VTKEDLIRVADTYLNNTHSPEVISIISNEEKLRNSIKVLPKLEIKRI